MNPSCLRCGCRVAADFVADCVDEDLSRVESAPPFSQTRLGALLDLEATVRVMVRPVLRGVCACCFETDAAVAVYQTSAEERRP